MNAAAGYVAIIVLLLILHGFSLYRHEQERKRLYKVHGALPEEEREGKPPKGGNMIRAKLRKARREQLALLEKTEKGDD